MLISVDKQTTVCGSVTPAAQQPSCRPQIALILGPCCLPHPAPPCAGLEGVPEGAKLAACVVASVPRPMADLPPKLFWLQLDGATVPFSRVCE